MIRRATEVIASDGLRARDNGAWGKDKLAFLQYFAPLALKATERKHRRYYVDLFAGPGINKVRNASEEFDGSPLRAVELHAEGNPALHFTDAVFINRDARDFRALSARLEHRIAAGRSLLTKPSIRCLRGDANQVLRSVLDSINPRSYLLVFADMEAPKQCQWNTIRDLRDYRGHESVDLYMLFPLDMALKRLVSSNPRTVEQSAKVLDGFYGDSRWRALLSLRSSGSDQDRERLGRGLLDLYVQRLREKWEHVDIIADVRRGMNHKLYKMLFASDDKAGKKIAKWAKARSKEQLSRGGLES